jgi:hypothetical protein
MQKSAGIISHASTERKRGFGGVCVFRSVVGLITRPGNLKASLGVQRDTSSRGEGFNISVLQPTHTQERKT